MRLILALLAAAACIALGRGAAGRLNSREKLLNAWEGALQKMMVLVAQGGSSLPSILVGGGEVNTLWEAAQLLSQQPALAPEKLLARIPWNPLLREEERETLQNALLGLFSPIPEMQLQALSYAREQWALFRKAGREVREANARLYASLGWLAGAAVFILMC